MTATPAAGIDDTESRGIDDVDIDGFTKADFAALAAAQGVVLKVCTAAASRVLARRRPELEERLAKAEAEAAAALAAAEPARAKVRHLRDELAECQRRAAEVHAASEDDDLTTRIEARSLRLALAEELEALAERIQIALTLSEPLEVAVQQADGRLRAVREDYADLEAAVAFPLFTSQGRKTKAWFRAMVASGSWYEDLRSADSREFLMEIALQSGLSDFLQREAIRAHAANDPRTKGVAAETQTLADGTRVLTSPDGRHVVVPGAVDPATLPGHVQVDSQPGSVVVEGLRAGVGWPSPPPAQPDAVHKAQRPEWRLPSPIADLYR